MSEINLHDSFDQRTEIKTSSDRSFGIVFAVFFAIVGIFPFVFGGELRLWSLGVAGAFLIVALVFPRILAPLNRVWTQFGLLLHRITNPLIMGLLFYVAVTPTALVFKILKKDPLRLRFDKSARTYWIERDPPGPAPETMKQQF